MYPAKNKKTEALYRGTGKSRISSFGDWSGFAHTKVLSQQNHRKQHQNTVLDIYDSRDSFCMTIWTPPCTLPKNPPEATTKSTLTMRIQMLRNILLKLSCGMKLHDKGKSRTKSLGAISDLCTTPSTLPTETSVNNTKQRRKTGATLAILFLCLFEHLQRQHSTLKSRSPMPHNMLLRLSFGRKVLHAGKSRINSLGVWSASCGTP